MENERDCISEINRLSKSIQGIELMVKLLLADNLIEYSADVQMFEKLTITEPLQNEMQKCGFKVDGLNKSFDLTLLSIVVPMTATFKDIQYIFEMFRQFNPEIMPMFQFSTINGMRRKRMLQEEIPFYVKNEEIHVFKSKGKKTKGK